MTDCGILKLWWPQGAKQKKAENTRLKVRKKKNQDELNYNKKEREDETERTEKTAKRTKTVLKAAENIN